MAVKKKEKKDINTGIIRVEKPTLEKVKKHCKSTRQSIGGFYTIAAEKELQTRSS